MLSLRCLFLTDPGLCNEQFRSLLRQSSQFSAFNFRQYARRRTKDAFREHQNETEDRKVQELIQDGLQNLRMMKVSGGNARSYSCCSGFGTPLSGRKEQALWSRMDHWAIIMAFTDWYLPSEANNYQPILPDGQVGCRRPGDCAYHPHCMPISYCSIPLILTIHRESKPEEKVISSVKRILGKIPWPCDFLYVGTVRMDVLTYVDHSWD